MNKVLLERFISKYSLGDNVTSVVWVVKDNVLKTNFITLEKSLLGTVALDNFQFEDIRLGIYNTAQLSRMLSVLGDDVKLTVLRSEETAISVKVEDVTDVDLMSFNADLFGKILQANKECSSGKLEISTQGLSRVTFKVDDYYAVYNLVATQNAD